MEKLLKKSFIEELKLDGTYNDASFAREYESEWSDAENAYFSAERFDKHRQLYNQNMNIVTVLQKMLIM